MLIKQPQINIVSREVTLGTGERVRAFFAIITTEGVQEVKFLGTKPLESGAQTEALLIAEPKESAVFGETPIRTIYEIFSPFYTLDLLVNQLARAPSVR